MRYITFTLTLLMLLTLSVGFPNQAHACSCAAGITQEQSYKNAAAVFSGRVLSVVAEKQQVLGRMDFNRTISVNRVSFDVHKAWKGIEADGVMAATAQHGATCGYNFEVGEEYLVYAHEGSELYDGKLVVGLCSRTQLLGSDQAQADLKTLGVGQAFSGTPGLNSTSTLHWGWKTQLFNFATQAGFIIEELTQFVTIPLN